MIGSKRLILLCDTTLATGPQKGLLGPMSGSARNFHFGAVAQMVRGFGSPSVRSRDKAPEDEAVCRQYLSILTAETSKI